MDGISYPWQLEGLGKCQEEKDGPVKEMPQALNTNKNVKYYCK